MGKTKIEWTRGDDGSLGETWNPVRGCSKVTPGCKHCYAEKVAVRFCGPGQPYEGLADRATGLWTGKVRLVPEHLDDPLRWRRPRRIFVNSMSDLFHEGLRDEDIERVFAVMALAPQHTFQVLTKRAERMRDWFATKGGLETREQCVTRAAEAVGKVIWDSRGSNRHAYPFNITSDELSRRRPWPGWPLPNVWLGVSVEDQQRAEERIPLLVDTPAAVRFLSCEPLLGPMDLSRWLFDQLPYLTKANVKAATGGGFLVDVSKINERVAVPSERLDWIIGGGESGPGARPCALEWLEKLAVQCRAAGVPYFCKQLGACIVSEARTVERDAGQIYKSEHLAPNGEVWAWRMGTKNKKGGDLAEFPPELAVRQFPEAP